VKDLESIGRIAILIFLLYQFPAKYAFYVFIAFRVFDFLRLFYYSIRFQRILKSINVFRIPKAPDSHLKNMPRWKKAIGTIVPLIIFSFVLLFLLYPDTILNNYVPSIDISGINAIWFRRMSIAFLSIELLYFWLKIHFKEHRSYWYLSETGILDYEYRKEKMLWSDFDSFTLNEPSSAIELLKNSCHKHTLHIVHDQFSSSSERIKEYLLHHLPFENQ